MMKGDMHPPVMSIIGMSHVPRKMKESEKISEKEAKTSKEKTEQESGENDRKCT